MAERSLRGYEKAAVVLLSMEEEDASRVMKELAPGEIAKITKAMASLRKLEQEDVSFVIDEFHTRAEADVVKGDEEYTKRVLSRALGKEEATRFLDGTNVEDPLEALRWMEPRNIANFIKGEHPQTVAIVLAHLDSNQAAEVMATLPEALRVDVAYRMASLEGVSSAVLKDLESALRSQLQGMGAHSERKVGGVKAVAEILNQVDRATEQFVLGKIEEESPELAESIRKLMFVFDDLQTLDDRGVQALLKEVSTEELSLSLKTASDALKEKIFKNMSSRAAEILKEDMETRGPTKLSDIEKAQQAIVQVAKKLEEEGKIVLGGKGGEELVV